MTPIIPSTAAGADFCRNPQVLRRFLGTYYVPPD
eukprot:CAMPEP_0195574258 /NCGR_PEP_ID=MMETSP0814-20130614/5849_1 /TAXON_ID=97485 /ORGANISM="Prymnesium parvum, Strain Texoma1" /LENGTH=33 /DNA_ID= /DNA_START= /DNA_END= /DNA_ORIENTATION=